MSPRLPALTPKQVLAALQRAGFFIHHTHGSTTISNTRHARRCTSLFLTTTATSNEAHYNPSLNKQGSPRTNSSNYSKHTLKPPVSSACGVRNGDAFPGLAAHPTSLIGSPRPNAGWADPSFFVITQPLRRIAAADFSRGFQPTVGERTNPRRVSDA